MVERERKEKLIIDCFKYNKKWWFNQKFNKIIIDCINCDGTYIGQTKQYLSVPICTHTYKDRVENYVLHVQDI